MRTVCFVLGAGHCPSQCERVNCISFKEYGWGWFYSVSRSRAGKQSGNSGLGVVPDPPVSHGHVWLPLFRVEIGLRPARTTLEWFGKQDLQIVGNLVCTWQQF